MEIDINGVWTFFAGAGGTVVIFVVKKVFWAGRESTKIATVEMVEEKINELDCKFQSAMSKNNEALLQKFSSSVTSVLSENKKLGDQIGEIGKDIKKLNDFLLIHETEEKAKEAIKQRDEEATKRERDAFLEGLKSVTNMLIDYGKKQDEIKDKVARHDGFIEGVNTMKSNKGDSYHE